MTVFEIPIIVSSSEIAGATNKTLNGSSFEIQLKQPIMIPRNVVNCTVQVDEATVWWTSPNISVAQNNNILQLQYDSIDYTLTIPTGLYSVSDLNNAIDREVVNAIGVSGLVVLEADNATQKVVIIITTPDVQIDFTVDGTFRDLIGFNSQLVPPIPSTGVYTILGDYVANFNTIEYFLLHSDIINQGIRVNDVYNQTIAQILIDVAPGSQIVSREYNPPKSDALHIRGSTIDRIKFWLTDQNNELVDTNSENFGCRMIIKYKI